MNKLSLAKRMLLPLAAIMAVSGCGSKSDGAKNESGVFSREYKFNQNGCKAQAKVTGKTQAEADQKICEAAADDSRNNY